MDLQSLVLFDVDGTLMEDSPTHKAAFSHAFREVYDVDADIDEIERHGMTDTSIILGVMKKRGLGEEEVAPKLNQAMNSMTHYFIARLNPSDFRLLPGVARLIPALASQGHILGLVTGNLEPIARARVEAAGIGEYFSVGGFGSDSAVRSELVAKAVTQARQLLVQPFMTFVVGDTPRDVEAGEAAGAHTVAVATGKYSVDRLRLSGADLVLPSLGEEEWSRLFSYMRVAAESSRTHA